jgi:hypothetical protein
MTLMVARIHTIQQRRCYHPTQDSNFLGAFKLEIRDGQISALDVEPYTIDIFSMVMMYGIGAAQQSA